MYEDDIFSPDQEEIFKGDGAALQAINLTASTTGDLIFMCVKKSLHFKNQPWTWNTLLDINVTDGNMDGQIQNFSKKNGITLSEN